uniref:Uncharacterized protein n=1 Tax=Anguilla anguilla TaxID=7936 RepID=A0A0E9VZL6_ANGAN
MLPAIHRRLPGQSVNCFDFVNKLLSSLQTS